MNEFFIGVKSLIVYDRKTLLVKRSEAAGIHVGRWEYPGGAMLFGETPHETLRREVREETGLDIEIGPLLFALTAMVGARHCVGLTYLSRARSDDVVLSEEHTDYVWVGKRQFMDMLEERLRNAVVENGALALLDID